MNLQNDGAVELQISREQGGGGHHLAQHFSDGCRVAASVQHMTPRFREFD